MTTTTLAAPARQMDVDTALRQIGRMNLLAISGGRSRLGGPLQSPGHVASVITLPVSNGYSVRVTLAASDTYTVERVFTRGFNVWVKGTMTDVYAEDLGEACYQASCFRNVEFGS